MSDDRVLEFSELLQESRSRVFGFIYALVLNTADSEDVFQQTATLLWEKFDQYESGTDFTGWALRVARFKAANFVRSRYRQEKHLSNTAVECLFEASMEAEDAAQRERIDALKGCLNRLPRSDRSLIQTCYGGEASIKEIAQTKGKTAGALYASLHRIRKALQNCVKRTLASGDH